MRVGYTRAPDTLITSWTEAKLLDQAVQLSLHKQMGIVFSGFTRYILAGIQRRSTRWFDSYSSSPHYKSWFSLWIDISLNAAESPLVFIFINFPWPAEYYLVFMWDVGGVEIWGDEYQVRGEDGEGLVFKRSPIFSWKHWQKELLRRKPGAYSSKSQPEICRLSPLVVACTLECLVGVSS